MAIDINKLLSNRRSIIESTPEQAELDREKQNIDASNELDLTVVDRYASCPSCKEDWDGGDILVSLLALDVFREDNRETIVNHASNGYGYNIDNPRKFSRLVVVGIVSDKESEYSLEATPSPQHFMMCPTCGNAWDIHTGKHLGSLNQARKIFKDEPNNN